MKRQSDRRDRTCPRYRVRDVEGSLLQASDIAIVDLSVDGVGIETHSALSVGRSYRLRVFRGRDPLDLVGVVAWSRLVRTEPTAVGDVVAIYRAGLNFDQSHSEATNAWRHFVGSKLSVSVDEHLLGRLSPQVDEITSDQIETGFAVDVISLSGLRIIVGPETDVQGMMKKIVPIQLRFGEVRFCAEARVLNFTARGKKQNDGFLVGMQWIALSPDNVAILDRYINDSLKRGALTGQTHSE